MLLTVCLVTKGREDYLPESLKSFETLFKYDYVKFLIIDNGSGKKSESILKNWTEQNYSRVKLFRFDKNDSRLSSYWNLIKDSSEEWIVFPGDDDEFCEGIIPEWFNSVNGKSKVVGFSASLQIMTSEGSSTFQNVSPKVDKVNDCLEKFAISLHHPPFNWPALFFKTSALPQDIPSSRFACDWWIGVYLQLSGQVLTTKSVAIRYRRHSNQESKVVPLRRKNLEAYIWLSDLIDQKNFINWINSRTESERITLWRHCIANPPIYGDRIFSIILLSKLYDLLSQSITEQKYLSELIQSYSSLHGVLLYKDQIVNLTHAELAQEFRNASNYYLDVDKNCCERLKSISQNYTPSHNASQYEVVCEHSSYTSRDILIKCSELSNEDESFNFDIISNTITSYLEDHGYLSFSLSPREKKILLYIRKLKYFIPGRILDLLVRIRKIS